MSMNRVLKILLVLLFLMVILIVLMVVLKFLMMVNHLTAVFRLIVGMNLKFLQLEDQLHSQFQRQE